MPSEEERCLIDSEVTNSNRCNRVESDLTSTAPTIFPIMSKRRIWKNVIALNFCIFIMLLGYQALSTLQSTMNSEGGIGMDTQATIYAFSMVSSILLPKIFIRKFGCKLTIIIMLGVSCPFITANIYPCWQTLIPTAIAFGLAFGPLNTSALYYMKELSLHYQLLVSETIENVAARFFGFSMFFLQNTQIWGNLLSYYVLMPGVNFQPISSNISCGVHFRDGLNETNPNLEPPPTEKRYVLISIYSVLGILSTILFALTVDSLENKENREPRATRIRDSLCNGLFAASSNLANPKQLLLLPITIYLGLEVAFYTGDFTQAYIACLWGVYHVGFVTIAFGVSGAVMCVLVGQLVKYFGQTFIVVSGLLIHTGIYLILLLCDWNSSYMWPFFLTAALWGMADGALQSQIAALYSYLFPEKCEAAFSNFYFWTNLGFFLSYSYANYLAIKVKVYILLSLIIASAVGYIVVRFQSNARDINNKFVTLSEDTLNSNQVKT